MVKTGERGKFTKMGSGSGRVNRRLYEATCASIRMRWDPGDPILAAAVVYADLERSGHIARPQPLAPILARLEREGMIALARGSFDREGQALHGAWNITRADVRLLADFDAGLAAGEREGAF